MGFEEFCRRLGGEPVKEGYVHRCVAGGETLFEGVEVGDVVIVNATPHELRFVDGTELAGSTFLARKLSARPVEESVAEKAKVKIVRTVFQPAPEGEEVVKLAREAGVLLAGSIISAQAYGYPPVVSPITTPETSRLPPPQRRVYLDKWNGYPK